MYIEGFSAAKDPNHPERNEDRLVAYGGVLFAVIDGVTDKSGRSYDGEQGGRIAGRALEAQLRRLVDDGGHRSLATHQLIDRLNEGIRAAYEQFGVASEAKADPNLRFSAALSAAFLTDERVRLIVVGDCGVRVDGGEPIQRRHPLDEVLSQVRALVFEALADAIRDPDQRLEVARSYTVEGIGRLPIAWREQLSEEQHRRIQAHVLETLPSRTPTVEPDAARAVAREGLRGGARHRNGLGPFGHGILDGFPLPMAFVMDQWLDRTPIRTLELFSDGYFGCPATSGTVGAWEERHDDLERTDPHRLHIAPSTKGSSSGAFADDRTVLIMKATSTFP